MRSGCERMNLRWTRDTRFCEAYLGTPRLADRTHQRTVQACRSRRGRRRHRRVLDTSFRRRRCTPMSRMTHGCLLKAGAPASKTKGLSLHGCSSLRLVVPGCHPHSKPGSLQAWHGLLGTRRACNADTQGKRSRGRDLRAMHAWVLGGAHEQGCSNA